MAAMPAATLITVAPTGAESQKDANPALPVTLDELVVAARSCQDAGAAMVHIHIRDDDGPPDPGPRPPARDGRGGAGVDGPDRPAVDRRRGDRPVRDPAGGPRRRPGLLLADHRDRQLRRRRLRQPLAVRRRALPAHPGPGDPAGVRAVRARPRDGHEPPARHVRRAGRRARARRLRDGRARGDARHRRRRSSRAWRCCPPGRPGRRPGSGGPACRSCSPRSSLGGNLRVGMEDTLTYGPKRPARDNAELVERAARLAAEAFRPAAAPTRRAGCSASRRRDRCGPHGWSGAARPGDPQRLGRVGPRRARGARRPRRGGRPGLGSTRGPRPAALVEQAAAGRRDGRRRGWTSRGRSWRSRPPRTAARPSTSTRCARSWPTAG